MNTPTPDAEPAVSTRPGPTIRVTQNGPYLVDGGLEVRSAEGQTLDAPDRYALCRCGGSANKPFCDGTHARIGFNGTETADRGPIAGRQDYFVGSGVTIHDDRTVCAHAGFCTDNLAAVFKLGEEPWIDAAAADVDAIVAQVKQCPSGALSIGVAIGDDLAEDDLPPGIDPVPNGPYRIRGAVAVLASDATPYEVRNRQTLCRCGGSPNKPFCDGTHARIGFRLRSKPGTRLVACGDPRPGTTPSQRQEVPSRALGTSESVADRIGLSSSV